MVSVTTLSFLDKNKVKRRGRAARLGSLLKCNCEGRRAEEIFAEETKHEA